MHESFSSNELCYVRNPLLEDGTLESFVGVIVTCDGDNYSTVIYFVNDWRKM
jgi:hypothetical protein